MTGSYSPLLVFLSVVVACVASYTALDLAGRLSSVTGRARLGWLLGGSLALGVGIWSMHFVGMLAFHLPIPVTYGVDLVLLSVLVAIAASGIALLMVSLPGTVRLGPLSLAALCMGLAIAGMHYIGMAAMRMQARLGYRAELVVASIGIAIGASFVALWLSRRFRLENPARWAGWKVVSGVVMGGAIAGMHYTAMAAARFTADPAVAMSPAWELSPSFGLGVAVTAGTLLILGLGLAGAMTDRWMRSKLEERVVARTAELKRSEAYLVAGQELSHTGSWARRVGAGEDHWSGETYRIFGLDPGSPAPSRQQISQICHPHDRDLFDQAMDAAVRETRGFELDFRIVRPDGSIRYVHSKGQPVLDDAGAVVEIMGVIMDVTQRKRAERALRRARERTLEARFAAMLAERTRMAREIHDTLLQGFTGVGLKLLAVTNRVAGQPETAGALREVLTLAQKTLEDARRAVWDMRSPLPAGAEFSAALRTAAEDGTRGTGLTLEYEVEGPARPVDPQVEAVVIRMVQEAVANAVKHAAARTLRVTCTHEARRVRLSVADDGRGFTVDPDFHAYGGHWGLLGMRERASQIGGKVLVRSTPGQGTSIILLVPYDVRKGSRPRRP
jgi:PAS domain S-box-containing protein